MFFAILVQFLHSIFIVGLVSVAAVLIIRYYFSFLKKDQPVQKDESLDSRKITLPLRLQACERIILFLERIAPDSLIMRLAKVDLTVSEFQSLLINTIREEFEYNLSQQLYISSTAWELVRNAKEETIRMINQAAGKVESDAPASELAKQVYEDLIVNGEQPVRIAVEEIKREIQRLF